MKMTPDDWAAVSAIAAGVQAIGTVAAIWASIAVARNAERRAAASERASLERERAAEAASVARAEAAERRADARERANAITKRMSLINTVEQQANDLINQVLSEIEPMRSSLATIMGGAGGRKAMELMELLQQIKKREDVIDLVEPLQGVIRATEKYLPDRNNGGFTASSYVARHEKQNAELAAAVNDFRASASASASATRLEKREFQPTD